MTPTEPTDEEVRDFIAMCQARGFIARGADGFLDLTPDGRAFLKVPNDAPSLIQMALEALCDEVVTEEMEKAAGRPIAGAKQ